MGLNGASLYVLRGSSRHLCHIARSLDYVCTACSSQPTLKVEKASEATSKLLTSTLSKYSLNKGPSSTILQQGIHVWGTFFRRGNRSNLRTWGTMLVPEQSHEQQ